MLDDIEKTVTNFVAEYISKNSDAVALESDLRLDLGIDGDDAEELLVAFSKKFSVEFSQEFDIERYFGPEGDPLLCVIYRAFGGKKYRNFSPMRVLDLVNAAKLGRWTDANS